MLQRFILSAWVGAAVLYVITSVAEQKSPLFDAVVRDQLATIRFPHYYHFGFIVHIVGGTFGFLAWRAALPDVRRRTLIPLLLIMVSAALITLDFCFIYQPLQELIIPPGQERSSQFQDLHNMSRHANEVHLAVMLLASLLCSWPLHSQMHEPLPGPDINA